jgi:hypothetical protein
MVTQTSVWATIFTCCLINLIIKFGLHDNILLIWEIKKLNSKLPPCKWRIASTTQLDKVASAKCLWCVLNC